MKAVIFLGLLFLFAGCFGPDVKPAPESLPEDFQANYSTGAMHLDWGYYQVNFDFQGNAELTKSAQGKTVSASYDFTREEMLELYTEILQNNFFALDETYQDPSIMDGGFSRLSVRANGTSHSVEVLNYHQPDFDGIASKIDELLSKKDSGWRELPSVNDTE
jgi:hypothetical protein